MKFLKVLCIEGGGGTWYKSYFTGGRGNVFHSCLKNNLNCHLKARFLRGFEEVDSELRHSQSVIFEPSGTWIKKIFGLQSFTCSPPLYFLIPPPPSFKIIFSHWIGETSVSDPYHFDLDPDPGIRIRVHGSGSEVTFDSVNRIFPIKCYARL